MTTMRMRIPLLMSKYRAVLRPKTPEKKAICGDFESCYSSRSNTQTSPADLIVNRSPSVRAVMDLPLSDKS